MTNPKTIVFIHGMYATPHMWKDWQNYFAQKGYAHITPAYPYHDGLPAYLRAHVDPGLGLVTLGQIVDQVTTTIDSMPQQPLLIGHSMGGLVVQQLIARGKGAAGICICSAPPADMMSFNWSFLKTNVPVIRKGAGNEPFLPSKRWFHYGFCNTLSRASSDALYEEMVVPESRNIARSSRGDDGRIDFNKPHAPLLFVAAQHDHIIPAALNRNNARAYRDTTSRTDVAVFPNRSHIICNQDGWQEVAEYVASWIASATT